MLYDIYNKPTLRDRVGGIYKIKIKRPISYITPSINDDLNKLLADAVQEPNERIVRINYHCRGQTDLFGITNEDGTASEICCEFIYEYNEVTGTELEQFETMLLIASIK